MSPELIMWEDHNEPSSPNVWWSPEDLQAIDGPAIIRTVGFVVREEEGFIVSVDQISEDGFTSQPLVILKSCIVSRVTLKA